MAWINVQNEYLVFESTIPTPLYVTEDGGDRDKVESINDLWMGVGFNYTLEYGPKTTQFIVSNGEIGEVYKSKYYGFHSEDEGYMYITRIDEDIDLSLDTFDTPNVVIDKTEGVFDDKVLFSEYIDTSSLMEKYENGEW